MIITVRLLFALSPLLLLSSGCIFMASRPEPGTWHGLIEAPPQQAKKMMFSTLSREPYDLNISSVSAWQIETDYYNYTGRRRGFWIFGRHWQERFYITGRVEISALDEGGQFSRIYLQAHPEERMNEDWEWRKTSNYDRAEKHLREIVRPLRHN